MVSKFTPEELEQLALFDAGLDESEFTLQDYRDAIVEEKQIQWLEKSAEERKRALYLKQYYADHELEIKAYLSEYYRLHREEILQKQRERYLKRKASIIEYQRLYAIAHPEETKQRKKKHWEKTKDAYNAERRRKYAERKAQQNATAGNI